MGGNALNFVTRRVDLKEFNEIEHDVFDILRKLYPNSLLFSLYNGGVRDKKDFGDLDILICKNSLDNYSFADIKKEFNAKDYNLNSNTWSFDYKDFQIDLVFVDPEHFESSITYYCRGDGGNLLGRIFHKFGLKFGYKGLSYVVKHGNYPFAEIILSKSLNQTLKFIGLDPFRYGEGFESLEEMFEFVSSSPFFNPDIYLLENVNHQSRTRDRKRATYCAFLKWCKNQDNLTRFPFCEDKSYWFPFIETYFPGFLAQLGEIQRQIAATDRFKSIYNGELVSSLTGLQGQTLGKFMSYIKEREGGKEEMMKKLLDNPLGVNKMIEEHYKKYI